MLKNNTSLKTFSSNLSRAEFWSPTMELRWDVATGYNIENSIHQEYIDSSNSVIGDLHCVQKLVLQQKWRSDMGNEKWVDVKIKKT